MWRKMSIIFIITVFLVAIVGCGSGGAPQSTNNIDENSSSSSDSQFVEYGVAGEVVELSPSESNLGTILVEGSEDNGAMYREAVVTVTPDTIIYLEDVIDFDQIEVGLYVNVFFEGPAKESHPVQVTAKQINVIPDDISN